MVATSHPAAAVAGLRALDRGGNAVDAALAAAAVLCVAEPVSTGIGGDLFALVFHEGHLYGLDAAGPAPRHIAHPDVERKGPNSITVPGAVAGWAALSERLGALGLDTTLDDAIDAAQRGVAVGAVTAEAWRTYGGPAEFGNPPATGDRILNPDLGVVLRQIAEAGPRAFYRGRTAEAIASCSWLTEGDLDSFAPAWVKPITTDYRGLTVVELPPPTQGVAALEALALLALADVTLADLIHCTRLALEDALTHVRDHADVEWLLDPDRVRLRRGERGAAVTEPAGGTSYVCAVDASGMAASVIQSLYEPFGSGVVAPGTGITLQNRAYGFDVAGAVDPGTRPFHTIIPALALNGETLAGAFGVVGGFMQAQGHVQLLSAIVDDMLDPQAALDRPRFRVNQNQVSLEEGMWGRAGEVAALGLEPVFSDATRAEFGCGQAIWATADSLIGGSDARGDGCAIGR
jgi:gamma-glutamyltranspeptidase/glutathione hydrolase